MVYVIILNYVSWEYTLECILSVLSSDYEACKILVIDNASPNDSLAHLSDGLKARGISFSLEAADIRRTKGANGAGIRLIQNHENRGFAAGNNVGLRIAMADEACRYVFLLNNDAVIQEGTIQSAVRHLESDRGIGILSLHVRDYDPPHRDQWIPDHYYCKWIGRPIRKEGIDPDEMLSYSGMAFLITKECLSSIGLMNEAYFMYCEEQDWSQRIKGRFRHSYAPDAVVYHRGGGTTRHQSLSAFAHLIRSTILFARQYSPFCLVTLYPFYFLLAIKKLLGGERERACVLWKMLFFSGNAADAGKRKE